MQSPSAIQSEDLLVYTLQKHQYQIGIKFSYGHYQWPLQLLIVKSHDIPLPCNFMLKLDCFDNLYARAKFQSYILFSMQIGIKFSYGHYQWPLQLLIVKSHDIPLPCNFMLKLDCFDNLYARAKFQSYILFSMQ